MTGYFSFSTLDYIILLMLLTISGAIGIFYGCFGKTQITAKELLIADRKMGVFPASMSLLAGFLSGASLLGIPSEMYYHGTMYLWTGESAMINRFYLVVDVNCLNYFKGVAQTFAIITTVKVFIPLYLRLDITSAHEVLLLTFSNYFHFYLL